MAETRIRRDAHGLYVRTDGAVFRPERTRHTYTSRGAGEGWSEGERVKAHHISQTPDARLRSLDRPGQEGVWHSHGSYIAPHRTSDEAWMPVEQRLRLRFAAEHEGDLEPILAALRGCGATVVSSRMEADEVGEVEVEVADRAAFRSAFKRTEAYEWLT
jgi:hypothetical protein